MGRGRRQRRLKRLALVLVVAAVAAPTAQARVAEDSGFAPGRSGDAIELVRLEPRGSQPGSLDAIELVRAQPREVSGPEHVAAPAFDWTDAGIGAGAALAAMVLAAGAALATRRGGRLASS